MAELERSAQVGGLARQQVEEGGETKYRVSLDYPELFPFLSNAEREDLRRELFTRNELKGGEENVKRLEVGLRLRAEAASLLGYDSWAAYRTETRMARSRSAVDTFLADLHEKVQVKADADMRELSAAKREHAGDAHGRYNALIRRLVSFERALELRRGRSRRRSGS